MNLHTEILNKIDQLKPKKVSYIMSSIFIVVLMLFAIVFNIMFIMFAAIIAFLTCTKVINNYFYKKEHNYIAEMYQNNSDAILEFLEIRIPKRLLIPERINELRNKNTISSPKTFYTKRHDVNNFRIRLFCELHELISLYKTKNGY